MEQEEINIAKRFNWEIVATLFILVLTILGATIPLHLHTSSQIDAIHQEMKDFHGRLCAIEERNKGK